MRSTEGGGSRPSSGVWSLLSLVRSSRASPTSSTSSGSVRSVHSFAYLPPSQWPLSASTSAPLRVPSPPSPTPSYHRRVSSARRRASCDRNLTLQTKYRLPIVHRGLTYDSFSLRTGPGPSRRVHVPGKRPAPPPPRARPAKRPAPPPPTRPIPHQHTDENIPLDHHHTPPHLVTDSKPTNRDSQRKTDATPVTLTPNRSFLRQIFDNKKRSSAIEVSNPPIKVLPNISELDRQAAEILKAYKMESAARKSDDSNQITIMLKGNSSKDHSEVWLCTKCLKKYNPKTKLCSCSTVEIKSNNSRFSCDIDVQAGSSLRVQNDAENKEKLKEMLIEMKHSLPKDPERHAKAKNKCDKNSSDAYYTSIGEAATLRIGTTIEIRPNQSGQLNNLDVKSFSSHYTKNKDNKIATTSRGNVSEITRTADELKAILDTISTKYEKELEKKNSERKSVASSSPFIRINEPLKISTLLNPIYVPKNYSEKNDESKDVPVPTTVPQPSCSTVMPSTSTTNTSILTKVPQSSKATINENSNSNKKSDTQPNMKSVTQFSNVKSDTQPIVKSVTQSNVQSDTQPNVKSETQSIMKTAAATRKSEASSQTSAFKVTTSASKPKKADETNLRNPVNESILKLSSRRDLINKLERSIATGDEHAAAEAATKLAQLKLSCAVLSFSSQIAQNTPSTSSSNNSEEQVIKSKNITKNKDVQTHTNTSIGSNVMTAYTNDDNSKKINVKQAEETKKVTKIEVPDRIVQIEVWIEDKSAARGPVRLSIRSRATLGALRQRAADILGVAIQLQRWVVQHKLCTDDTTLLTDLAGQNLDVPFYLCLVESDLNQGSTSNQTAKPMIVRNEESDEKPKDKQPTENNDIYNELMQLERNAIVRNTEPFECPVCMEQCKELEGVVLRQCVHMFCRECLSLAVRHCVEPEVSCLAQDCTETLQEREVRALVSLEEYERWLARGLSTAESRSRNAFHCLTSDCKGWAFCEPGVQQFNCPVCRHVSCVSCKAIHEGSTCSEHKTRLTEAVNPTNNDEDGTKALLDTLISKGEALKCPECNAIIVKKWGCDWVRCSACKTEICWVTKGPRWGPAGRGDTSAGCRCGVDGKKCHPSCTYCH